MTLDQMATDVMARLNLTTAEAEARIKSELNSAYRKVTAAIGLITARRSSDSSNTAAGNAEVTFDLEKIERIYDAVHDRALTEATYDDVRAVNVEYGTQGIPWRYAIKSTTSASVTVVLDPIPNTVFALTADGYSNASTLADGDSPAFAADFHDILIHDVLKIEHTKMEKPQLAAIAKADYEQRLSDLKFFLAKSSSLSIVQGQNSGGRWPRRPGVPSWRW